MSVRIMKWKNLSREEQSAFLKRSETDISRVMSDIGRITEDVRLRGDAAVAEYSLRFEKVDLTRHSFRVQDEEFEHAEASLSPGVKDALRYSIENIEAFHKPQLDTSLTMHQIRPGILAGERSVPIPSCGLYVPRGRGSFPSMLYMLAVPARVAGVKQISVMTPPLPDGRIDPACLYAAKICGVHNVYRFGGAHGIAALAYGTESIPRVSKIVGPGSQYVAAAKRIVSGVVDVGLPAGPSESMILADGSADPRTVALDLLVEAEHGADSSAILITDSESLATGVRQYADGFIAELPEPRKGFVEAVMAGYGGIILVDTLSEGIHLINDFAPEHLLVNTRDPFAQLPDILYAGEILLGSRVPFSAANYAIGPNAVLPTGGKARTFSAVSVHDFRVRSSVIHLSENGYASLKGPVETLAEYEGFTTHKWAFSRRDDA